MCDHLLESALAYQRLNGKRYHILLGHRGRLASINISFPASGYHHLAGLHYLGINALNNRKTALDKIIRGEVALENTLSQKLETIKDRLLAITQLESMISECRRMYRYKGFEQKWSSIRADYVIAHQNEDGPTLLFVIGSNGVDLVPTSVFASDPDRYTQNCPPRKILRITEEDIGTGKMTEVFCSPAYKQ